MSNKKRNLPAINELNIFTSVKNVDNLIVEDIIEHIRKAKKIKLRNADSFNILIFKDFINLNVDTVMYLIEHYSFDKQTIETNYDNKIYVTSEIRPKENIKIRIASEKWKINLLPSEIKEIIYTSANK